MLIRSESMPVRFPVKITLRGEIAHEMIHVQLDQAPGRPALGVVDRAQLVDHLVLGVFQVGEPCRVEGIGEGLIGLVGADGHREQIGLEAVTGHERARLVPEFLDRDVPPLGHEIRAGAGQERSGSRGSRSRGRPMTARPRLRPADPPARARRPARPRPRCDRSARGRSPAPADRANLRRDSLRQDFGREHRGDVKVGDPADPVHHIVSPETFRVGRQHVLGRAKGDVAVVGYSQREQPQQGRELRLRPADLLETREVEVAVGRERVGPGGDLRRAAAAGQFPGLVQVVEGPLVQARRAPRHRPGATGPRATWGRAQSAAEHTGTPGP